jgi:CHASE2 domain-containing sensor protein
MRVFISYRRDDSMVTAALLYRELTSRPEFADAFMDIRNIGYGDNFVASINKALGDAEVVVVVIGPRWIEMLQARLRGDDWVRHEVATALHLSDGAPPGRAPLRVVPVLIGGAKAPAENALPDDLAPLARIAMQTFDERALITSINTLLETLQKEEFEAKSRRLEEERRKLEEERRQREIELEEERRQREIERKRRIRVRIASVAAALVLFLAELTQLFDFIGLDERVAIATMLLARIGASAPAWSGKVVLVGIDEASERAIGRKFDPNWRAEHAALIANVASAAARTVAFDTVLEDPTSDIANAALRDAIAAAREKMPVIFGVQSPVRDGAAIGAMLDPFASLARRGVACLGLEGGQAITLPLAIVRDASAGGAAADQRASASATGDAGQRAPVPVPAFGLAAYSGGGLVELPDEIEQSVGVRLRHQQRSQKIDYYKARTLRDPKPGCEVLQPGDRVFGQLIDPYALPPLRTTPQRIAYERVVAGDPAALALLKDRIVLVGTTLPGKDRQPLPWPAEDRWGVELFAAQIDAMARDVAIVPIHRGAEWALLTGLALLGVFCGHRLRDRRLRIAALTAIALAWTVAAIAWYRSEHQLIGVPYGIAALFLGAWFANRKWMRRKPT